MTPQEAWKQCQDPDAMLRLYAVADNANAADLWVLATVDLDGLSVIHHSQNINAVSAKMRDVANCAGWCRSLCTTRLMNLPDSVKATRAKWICNDIRFRLKPPIFKEN